jgi:ketosteroid isomerase-like protein
MTEHQNASVLRRAYEAFARGDFAALSELLADDVVWHVPGRSLVSGSHHGREALLGYFGRLMELSGGTFKAEPHDILANDRHVVSLEHLTAQREGKLLDVELALVVRVGDGRIVEARDYFSDQNAWDEFWL